MGYAGLPAIAEQQVEITVPIQLYAWDNINNVPIRLTTSNFISGVSAYRTSFTNANLSAGVLTVTHNIGNQYVVVQVFDNNNNLIVPDNVAVTSTSVVTITLTSWGSLTGSFNVVVIG